MEVCHIITKPELGGAQLSALNILSGLPKDRYEVSIITSPKGILASELRNIKDISFYFIPFLARPLNPIADIIALINIYLIYRRQKFALIHTHSSKAGILGRWAALLYNLTECCLKVKGKRCKVIHTVHGWSFNDYQTPILKRFFIFLEKITALFTTRIICVSNKDIETGLTYKIAPPGKFVLIKYGIPLAEFRRTPTNKLQKRKELGITNNDPIVGMISCLKPQKSPLDYIKACMKVYEKMPDVNFLLVGDGGMKSKCKKFLAATPLDGRFIFTGWRRDVSEILDILDVVVLTSKWEGVPISVIEALCKGKPVVVTDTGGVREIVKDGVTGYLTRPGSPEEIAQKVLEVLQSRTSFSARMGREASSSIDDSFDVGSMVKKVDELYRRIR